MLLQKAVIDAEGRLTLPQAMRQALGLPLSHASEIILELSNTEIVLKPVTGCTPLTDALADMGLPVADWEWMEQEIEAGYRA